MPAHPGAQGRPEADRGLEGRAAAGEQVVAGVAFPPPGCRRRALRDLQLGQARAAGQLLDGGAVEVARREIHVEENARRGQCTINQADPLDGLAPVDPRDQPQAGNDVLDGRVRGGMGLQHLAHGGVDRRAAFAQAPVEPGRRRVVRAVAAQAMHELHREGIGDLDVAERGVHLRPWLRGLSAPARRQAVRHGIRLPAVFGVLDDDLGHPAQVLDQRDAQRGRYGAEFADGKRLDLLVGQEVPAQGLRLEMAVGMGDQRPRRPEHAGQAGEGAVGNLREFQIVAGW